MNDNILYKNREFHLQTEDGGSRARVVTTQLFLQGAVIASTKTDCTDFPDTPEGATALRQLMAEQHRALWKELLAGKLDQAIG